MAFLYVQSSVNAVNPGTSLTITLPSPVTTNNFLVINLKFAGSTVTNVAITDNSGTPNTYALATSRDGAGNRNMQYYGVQTRGGATTVTVSWTSSVAARIGVDEFSGGALTNAAIFDTAVSNAGTGTSGSMATFNPSATGELVAVGYMLNASGTFTAGTNYAVGIQGTNMSTEYRLNSSTSETAPATWVNSVSWTGIAGVYKPYVAPVVGVSNNALLMGV